MGQFSRYIRISSLAITGILLSGAVQAGQLFGTSFEGTLYDVNITTGVAFNPANTGLSNLAGIAFRSNGSLYGMTSYQGTPTSDALFRIDPFTGASTLVGSTGFGDIREGDIAFDPLSGRLYGIQALTTTTSRGLFTINVNTGEATLVGDINASTDSDLSGLAFDSSGHLYVLDSAGSLLNIDPTTGQVLSTVALNMVLGTTAGLAFDPETGIAYVADGGIGGSNNLYTLDVTTGALTLIGNTGLATGLSGLAFIPYGVIIPEPTSFIPAATAASVLGLAHAVRRRYHGSTRKRASA